VTVHAQPTRTGARRPSDVPTPVRRALEAGEPSVNHMEQIAMDMKALWSNTFPEFATSAQALSAGGLVTKMRVGGMLLWRCYGWEGINNGITWRSDTVRGWAAMAAGAAPDLSLAQRLRLVRAFADDHHFAVREWAWLSVRPHIADDIEVSIRLLRPWVSEDSPRLRRFPSEVTRPRGVWSRHIKMLKSEPQLGLPILEPLRKDESRYVQDSVANWLNDAAKSNPRWVLDLCGRWSMLESGCSATERICRRALRSVRSS
jgi:3-methyladenine DNA glycosylase AlkC